MMKTAKLLFGSLAAAAALILSPITANADVVIVFDNSGSSSGTVSYGGGGGPASGTDITFDIVTVDDGVNPVVELDCTGCSLDFTTGNLVVGEEGPPVWEFSGGGSFVITGTITDPNNGDALVASGTLLSGEWVGAAASWFGPGQPLTLGGTGIDSKNQALLDYFGITETEWIYASTNITTQTCSPDTGTGSFECVVEEADVTNTSVIPEPGLLTLFGLGLLGVGSAARRRLAARRQ